MTDCGLDALLAELNLEPVALTDAQRDVVKQWKSYAADLVVRGMLPYFFAAGHYEAP